MLPNLPKKNEKREADFGLVFRRWWETSNMKGPFELKDSRGEESIPFSEVSNEQLKIALRAKTPEGVLVRVIRGTTGTADYIGFRSDPSWIVIRFPNGFCVIDAQEFADEKLQSPRKSLTSSRAKELCTVWI
jgi:hypothetical protein